MGRKGEELDAARSRIAELQAKVNELEAASSRSASRDATTGLLNLRRFRERLEAEVGRSARHRNPLTLALLDIDGFRAINERHGFDTGDKVLTTVGAILASYTRGHDLACRTGGDEFALLLLETDGEGATRCFERILLELEVLEVGELSHLTASVGAAVLGSADGAAGLMTSAEHALQRARAAGGGRAALAGMDSGQQEPGSATGDDAQRDVVVGLATALTARDSYTGEHSESVVDLVGRVGQQLGLDDTEVERARTAALLHDIGKVAIPDELLLRAGPLVGSEWDVMREHPVIGERILRTIPGLGHIARIVRHEHERWDGGGYPDGLAGEDIPLASRIILACDAYHAMTSDRPYRAAMTHAEAIRELSTNAGTQFDPNVVQILIGCMYSHRQVANPV